MKGREIKLAILIVVLLLLVGAIFYFSNSSLVKKDRGAPDTASSVTATSTPPPLPAAETRPPLRAAGAYLITSGESLYAVGEEKSWPIASITKLMTAFTARRLIPAEEIVTINDEAVATSGNVGDFKAGERFESSDLVRAMLVASSNDAAKALALHYGEAEFTAQMNLTAKEMGMDNTNFVETTGLSPQNLSTVNDLNMLVAAIWRTDPDIFIITRLPTTTLVDIDTGRSRKLVSTIAFAGRSDFLGGKTGQLPEANGNLVSIFSLPDKSSPVVVIVLGAQDRFRETEKILAKL